MTDWVAIYEKAEDDLLEMLRQRTARLRAEGKLPSQARKCSKDEFEKFAEYVIYYPEEDDPDFDGEHYGGIKGIADDAPEDAKYAFKKYMYEYYEAQRFNRKI